LLAGAGLGFAQILLAKRHSELEHVTFDLGLSMPVWLVLHEEVRANARLRRVADLISTQLTDIHRSV